MSIGSTVRQLVLENPELSNADILTKVKELFPQAKTTMACIAWYKSDMRKKGLIKPKNQPTLTSVNLEIETLQARLKVLEELKAKLEEEQAKPEEVEA